MSAWFDVMYDHLTSEHKPDPGSYEEYVCGQMAEVFDASMGCLGRNLCMAGAFEVAVRESAHSAEMSTTYARPGQAHKKWRAGLREALARKWELGRGASVAEAFVAGHAVAHADWKREPF